MSSTLYQTQYQVIIELRNGEVRRLVEKVIHCTGRDELEQAQEYLRQFNSGDNTVGFDGFLPPTEESLRVKWANLRHPEEI